MTLTTHAVVGALATTLFPTQPVFAFVAAFASHLAIDALPHWDYDILSKRQDQSNRLNDDIDVKDKNFIFDLVRMGSDAVWGTCLSLLIFSIFLSFPWWLILLGAWFGMLPDALQFVYMKTHSSMLLPLQRFHRWVQKGKSIYPPFYIGIVYQVVLVVVLLIIRFTLL